MLAIWKTGEGNVKSFMENMDNPPPYTLLLPPLSRTWRKKDISKAVRPAMLMYISPAISEQEYKKSL